MGDEVAGRQMGLVLGSSVHTENNYTYIFLSVKHEVTIQLGKLAEGHIAIPHLRVLKSWGESHEL